MVFKCLLTRYSWFDLEAAKLTRDSLIFLCAICFSQQSVWCWLQGIFQGEEEVLGEMMVLWDELSRSVWVLSRATVVGLWMPPIPQFALSWNLRWKLSQVLAHQLVRQLYYCGHSQLRLLLLWIKSIYLSWQHIII